MNNAQTQKMYTEIKNPILDSLTIIAFVAGTPAFIISYMNARSIGHFPYFSILGILLLMTFIVFRKKIPYNVKGWSMIIIGYLIGTIALLHEGILSDGLLYYIIIGILTSMLINIRSGIIITIISIATASFIAFMVSTGWHTYDFDIVQYFYSSKSWIAFVLTAAFFTAVAVYIYGRLESYLVQYIDKLTAQSAMLSHSKIRLEKEITERQSTEVQLTESENRFKKVFNSIGDGIILLAPDHTVQAVNDSFLQMTGITRNKVIQKSLVSLFFDSQRINSLLNAENQVTSLFSLNENWLKKGSDDATIPVEVRILPLSYEKDINNIVVIKDITSKKETEARIMHAVISSEEEERKRIAQDLHDSVGPYLSAAKLYVSALVIDDNDRKGHEIKKELNELLNLSISSIREIAGNLGSHVLRSSGLFAALSDFISKINTNNKINFNLQIPQDSPFIEKVEIALYRIMVELINNSVKYSSATNISMHYSKVDRNVVLEYDENGVGFDVAETLAHHKGMGLYNIHSRIHSLGGLVEYNSSPGKGVMVRIIFDKDLILKQDV